MSTILDRRAPAPDKAGAPETATRKRPGLGVSPRVDLLPQALRVRQHQKRVRRWLRVGLVGVVALVALGTAGGMVLNATAQGSLAAAQDETLNLLGQQAQYSELKGVQERIALTEAAQAVGAGTEVDWSAYLGALRATLPAGVTLTSVSVDSASPTKVYEQPTVPLEGARIATLTFSALSPALPDVPTWIDALATLPAFVDAIPDSVTLDDSGAYVVNMTMHIGADAYSGRFAPAEGGAK
jgi:Tfp pilus assembly protein PilN